MKAPSHPPHTLPKQEQPREKLLARGADQLSDIELLVVVLGSGTAGHSVFEVARSLLNQFNSLGQLLQADLVSLCRVPGLGPAKSSTLKAVSELAQRQLKEEMITKEYLQSSANTRNYLKLKYQHQSQEVFSCVFLDSQHGVIVFEELFKGSLDKSHVYPRELIKKCLRHNAAAVIFAHNHPSGLAEPSPEDIHLTQYLQQALAYVDIKVLDHLIIGNHITSFADNGLL
ncbi:MAG: DNA repair protein RadC [Pseudomonadota bacterium]